jgi:hypothetical protein
MKLKLDDAGHVVLQEGKPVYVADDGKEIAFDAPTAFAKIGQLTGENRAFRTRADTAEASLKIFEGIDPAAAKKAIDTVKNLDDKKLIDAGQAETIKTEAIRAVEEKYKPVVEKLTAAEQRLVDLEIGGAFSNSKFVAEKVAYPASHLRSIFGQNLEIKDGKIVAKDRSGNPIYSRSKPGELADFDEAIEHLVETDPAKDSMLKAPQRQGDGKQPGAPGGPPGARTMSRQAFNQLDPAAQMNAMTGPPEARVTVTE